MINRKSIIAISQDGTAFVDDNTLRVFKQTHPGVYTIKIGNTAAIQKRKLISYGTTGKVVGFDQSSAGKLLVLLKWHKDAAPLRVGIEAIMPNAPEKFWMVIPFNSQSQSNIQDTSYSGSARRTGISPAVHRFTSRLRAEEHVARERMATRFHDYVILESVQFHAGDIVVQM